MKMVASLLKGVVTESDRKGIALIMVLWVLTILMVIVFSFSYMTRTETHSTLAFKEGMERKFISEAGLERAIMEIFYRRRNLNVPDAGVWKTDMTPNTGDVVGGHYSVAITDESGKLDINTAPDIILRNLLNNLGTKGEDADIIVDSILDWKDPDDLTRLNGAETDYYMSLPKPYKARNADFETVEELLLVRGVTPEILYGKGDHKGIFNFLTVHSRVNTVNINAAPKEVLAAVPGITPEIAEGIVGYRENTEIRNIQEVIGLFGENYSLAAPYLRVGEGNTYTIDSKGFTGEDKTGFGIRATVVIKDDKTFSYVYYKRPFGTN